MLERWDYQYFLKHLKGYCLKYWELDAGYIYDIVANHFSAEIPETARVAADMPGVTCHRYVWYHEDKRIEVECQGPAHVIWIGMEGRNL